MIKYKIISATGLFLLCSSLYSQALWEVEVDTSVSPIELLIVVVTEETTHELDRVTQIPPDDSNDTLMVNVFMEPCGLPGAFNQYNIALELEEISHPFNLCVNTYVDTLIDNTMSCGNDSLIPGDFLCTSAGEVLSLWERDAPQPLSIYPNPARDKVKIRLPQATGDKEFSGAVYTSSGRVVKKFKCSGTGPMEVDIRALEAGLYILRLIGEDNVWQSRLVKTRH